MNCAARLDIFPSKDTNRHLAQTADADPLISPAATPTETLKRFPRTCILVGSIDPLLDDSVRMAEVLRKAGVDVTLRIYDGLPHGFLNLSETIPKW